MTPEGHADREGSGTRRYRGTGPDTGSQRQTPEVHASLHLQDGSRVTCAAITQLYSSNVQALVQGWAPGGRAPRQPLLRCDPLQLEPHPGSWPRCPTSRLLCPVGSQPRVRSCHPQSPRVQRQIPSGLGGCACCREEEMRAPAVGFASLHSRSTAPAAPLACLRPLLIQAGTRTTARLPRIHTALDGSLLSESG